jgi:type III secretion protein R
MNLLSSDPLLLIGVLVALAVMPVLLIGGTCFLKIAMVLMIVRNAIGVQQVPPQIAIYGIALCLTFFIMAPVGSEMADHLNESEFSGHTLQSKLEAGQRLIDPWRRYLQHNASEDAVDTFMEISRKRWPPALQSSISTSHLAVLLPAFVLSELQRAFEIGFLLYIPFIIVDIVVSNILLALGMQMVAPMTFSLPLKLLLFVAVDGWRHLLTALAGGVY